MSNVASLGDQLCFFIFLATCSVCVYYCLYVVPQFLQIYFGVFRWGEITLKKMRTLTLMRVW